MISQLLPLTKNKMEILKRIYEDEETHPSEISKKLGIHPYSMQKTLNKLRQFLRERKAGKTNLISLDKNYRNYLGLVSLIEDYRLKTKDKNVESVINHLANLFYEDNIIVCCLFGSYARETYDKNSDIDILIIVKKEDSELKKKISQFSSVIDKEVNPLVLDEEEFEDVLKKKEPAIMSLKKPSQRMIIKGANYFIEKMER